jgi:prepilin-type processing-associated H-X9-DG protein
MIYPYVKSTAVYKCPDDALLPDDTCSYGFNSNLVIGNASPITGQKVSVLSAPASTVCLAEVTGNGVGGSTPGYRIDVEDFDKNDWSADCGAADLFGGGQCMSPAGMGWANQSDPSGLGSYWYWSGSHPNGDTNGTLQWNTGVLPGSAAANFPEYPNSGTPTWQMTKTGPHSGGSNIVFCDGHAKWLMPGAICAGETNPNATDCGAYADKTDWPPYAAGTSCSLYGATWSTN